MSSARIAAFLLLLGATPAFAQGASTTFVGVVTDSMCDTDHQSMKVSPDEKCVRDCVGDSKTFKFALASGTHVYLLSDQETPGSFAGRKVRVTGVLYEKTGIIKVEKIEAVK